MMLLSSVVRDLSLQQMQGKRASQTFILTQSSIKLIRSRMIKRDGKYALVRNHLQNLSDSRESFKEQKLSLCFQNIQKPKFLSRDRVRRLKSKLFRFSITQDILVDTWKFIGSGEAWNNLYLDFQIKEMNPLSPLKFTRG
jgi:hypothetical protein